MKPFTDLIPFEAARAIIDDNIHPVIRIEKIPIDEALGRVLAEDVTATHSTPPFDRAGVDGYAVRARDTVGASPRSPKKLKVVDTLYAGSVPTRRVSGGECVQIATGASMPKGADAVVMLEDIRRKADVISIFKPLQPAENIGKKGEDIQKGELVLKQGTFLEPGKVGVLASQGLRRVSVYAKPRVAIMPTGEEIAPVGRRLRGGQIYDINSHTLSAVVEDNGGLPITLPITGDNPDAIQASLREALPADMVLTSGGSSVGEKDLLFDSLVSRGKVLFHGIKVKPGKPTTFAVVQGKPVLGMPGYPTSCLINAYLLLVPALRKMARLPPRRSFTLKARLGENATNNSERRRFLPVRLEGDVAWSVFKESGAITSMARADGYIVIPENTEMLKKGSRVIVTLF